MNGAIAILVAGAAAVALVILGLKMAGRGGEDKERARTLAESAREQARVDKIMAGPLGSKHDRLARIRSWRKLRKSRSGNREPALSDDE